jgi:uncharacterized protein YaiL (DUF2058 family)
MNKAKSFIKSFVAAIKGDDAEAQAAKVWRQVESGLTMQIAALKGDLIRKEDTVTDAQEALDSARINSGKSITDRDSYVAGLIQAKERLIQAEKQLEAHQKTIAFLEEEYKNLKAE